MIKIQFANKNKYKLHWTIKIFYVHNPALTNYRKRY